MDCNEDLDILGRPWTPCPQCPRRAENGGKGNECSCPSRSHRPYCDHVRDKPEFFGPIVREWPNSPFTRQTPAIDPQSAPSPVDLSPLAAANPIPSASVTPVVAAFDPAVRDAIFACSRAGETPDTFGQTCGCSRACDARGGPVTYRDCYACREADAADRAAFVSPGP